MSNKSGPSLGVTAELHRAHKAAMSHSAEVLHLQFELDTHAAISQHEVEEASWSVLGR